MPIVQRGQHVAKNIEELIFAGIRRNFWSEDVVLFFPINIPQLEEWIPVKKGLP